MSLFDLLVIGLMIGIFAGVLFLGVVMITRRYK